MKRKRFKILVTIKEILESVIFSWSVFYAFIIFALLYRGDESGVGISYTLRYIGDISVKIFIVVFILAIIKEVVIVRNLKFKKMESKEIKKLSSIRIILVGNLIVNLPVTIIIFVSTIVFLEFDFSFNLSLIISTFIGWYFWEKLLIVWKKWAFSKNVSPERLFKLGKRGLINYFRSRIFD